MSMLGPDENSSTDESVKSSRRFKLPKLGRKSSEASKVENSNFALGSGSVGDKDDPFSAAFNIEDNIGHIPSEEESRKSRKGKSNLRLGAKYGGRRKAFLFLAAALTLSLLLSMLNFMMLTKKMNKNDAQKMVDISVADSTAKTFPVGKAGMWLESFIRVYGTWDYKTPGARAADLSPYLAQGMDPQAGWDGKGTQQLIYSSVSSQPEIIARNRAVFDFTYQIQDGTWRCAKVPVFSYKPTDAAQGPTDQWGFAITANPTPVPCALRVSVPEFSGNDFTKTDQKAATTLKDSFFPGFFTAWIGSDADTLRQYMSPNVKSFGLGGAYQSNPEITAVTLPIGDTESAVTPNSVYAAYVDVTLSTLTGAKLKVTYKVPVTSNGSQWQVMGEPAAMVQQLDGIGGDLPTSTGKKTDTGEGEANNEYPKPTQTQAAQQKDQSPSAPAASASKK